MSNDPETTKNFPTHKIGNSAVWSVANNTLGQALVLGIFLITARFVSKEDFGIMAICFLIVDGFRQFFIESVGTALTAKDDTVPGFYNAGFLIMLIGSICSAVFVFAFAGPISDLINNHAIETPLRYISVLILTVGLSRTHEAWLSRHFMFKALALRTIVSVVVGGSIGIAMAIHGMGIAALIVQQLTTALLGTIFLWVATSWSPGLTTNKATVLSLLHYSKHVAVTRGFSFFNGQSDIFFASYYLGAAATGVYSTAKRIMLAINNVLNDALGKVSLPAFAAARNNPETMRTTFFTAVTITSMLTAPFLGGLATLSTDIVHLLLGNKWLDAAPIISIMAVNAYVTTITMYTGHTMLVYNKPNWQSAFAAAQAITNVVLLLFFAHQGLAAIAWIYAIRTIAFTPISVSMVLHLLNSDVKTYLKTMTPSVLCTAIMIAALLLLGREIPADNSLLRLLILVPFGAVIYTASLFLLDRKNCIFVFNIARNIIRRTP